MLISEIIDASFREGNILAIGKAPTTAEISEALPRLNNFITSLFGFEIGENLIDWPIPQPQRTAPVAANYPAGPGVKDLPSGVYPYPPSNVRLLVNITTAFSVFLQNNPHDGANVTYVDLGHTATLTVDGNGRFIQGKSTLDITPSTPILNSGKRWFYRADLGDWILVNGSLETGDNSPLPDEFDDLLITGLSMRLSPRYGLESRDGTLLTYKTSLGKLRTRYRQPTPTLGGASQIPNSSRDSNNLMQV